MATDYDELRTDVKECKENSLEALKTARAPDAQALGETGAMQRAVRVFIGEGTFCPSFQEKDGLFHEPVLRLFDQAMSLKIPHNVFAGWRLAHCR